MKNQEQYDRGYQDAETAITKFVIQWEGQTNSALGVLLENLIRRKTAVLQQENQRMKMLLQEIIDAPYMEPQEARKFLCDIEDKAQNILT